MLRLLRRIRNASHTSVIGTQLSDSNKSQVASVVRCSFLYRWLTKEPEPTVIIIDLHETLSVGPICELLNRAAIWITPFWKSSLLKSGLDTVEVATERAVEAELTQSIRRILFSSGTVDPPNEENEEY